MVTPKETLKRVQELLNDETCHWTDEQVREWLDALYGFPKEEDD